MRYLAQIVQTMYYWLILNSTSISKAKTLCTLKCFLRRKHETLGYYVRVVEITTPTILESYLGNKLGVLDLGQEMIKVVGMNIAHHRSSVLRRGHCCKAEKT